MGMAKLPTIRRMASSILKCGQNKVWLDPTNNSKLAAASSRPEIRTLIEDGFIMKKRNNVHSKFHSRKLLREKQKGRHMGPGKVKGCKNARFPEKQRWISRIRDLRTELKSMRESALITPTLHKTLYRQVKGNLFKNVGILREHVLKLKDTEKRQSELEVQAKVLRMG